ncbi:serine hydrolase domain-containing protein [Nocardioides sp.]|uniref:serine hydrolase domain-containing protein n=1 Tax=Nocardioides sp. TaxID=35761 RepID=UPI003528FF1A
MPTTNAGSRLAGLTFTDPQHVPGWTHAVLGARPDAAALPRAERGLAVEVLGAGRRRGLGEWLAETWATSLLVLDHGTVVHEWYADGLGPDTLFLGASMTKSVLAHLVGRAVHDGALAVSDPVTAHVPELAGSGYDGTTVLDVLTMTTGVAWVEDHRDPASLASRLLACFAEGGDSRALLREVRPDVPPGTRFAYNTADSQVLDWVRERATGRGYVDDAARLWRDLGCTRDAVVAVDGHGVAMAGGGLAATTGDWARVALLAVDGVAASGERLVGADWADAAARPAYPFTGVGRLPSTITTHAGFGLHWWPMDDAGRRVTADGSRGQFACADRRTGAVVVKTSAWPYDDVVVDRQARDLSYLGLHAILDTLGDPVAPTPISTPKEDTP